MVTVPTLLQSTADDMGLVQRSLVRLRSPTPSSNGTVEWSDETSLYLPKIEIMTVSDREEGPRL